MKNPASAQEPPSVSQTRWPRDAPPEPEGEEPKGPVGALLARFAGFLERAEDSEMTTVCK